MLLVKIDGKVYISRILHGGLIHRQGKCIGGRDLQYISIWQYIDILIEYCIVILCSINIEISKYLIVHILCC